MEKTPALSEVIELPSSSVFAIPEGPESPESPTDSSGSSGSSGKKCEICGQSRGGQCSDLMKCPECEKEVCCDCLLEHSHCPRRLCVQCHRVKSVKNDFGKFRCNECDEVGYWKSIHKFYHERA